MTYTGMASTKNIFENCLTSGCENSAQLTCDVLLPVLRPFISESRGLEGQSLQQLFVVEIRRIQRRYLSGRRYVSPKCIQLRIYCLSFYLSWRNVSWH